MGYKCVRNDAWYYNCQGNMNNSGGNSGGNSGNGGGSSPIAFKPDPPVPAKKLPNGESSADTVLQQLQLLQLQQTNTQLTQ